jgi:hypothetical protein
MKAKSDAGQFYDFSIFQLYGIEDFSHITLFYNN